MRCRSLDRIQIRLPDSGDLWWSSVARPAVPANPTGNRSREKHCPCPCPCSAATRAPGCARQLYFLECPKSGRELRAQPRWHRRIAAAHQPLGRHSSAAAPVDRPPCRRPRLRRRPRRAMPQATRHPPERRLGRLLPRECRGPGRGRAQRRPLIVCAERLRSNGIIEGREWGRLAARAVVVTRVRVAGAVARLSRQLWRRGRRTSVLPRPEGGRPTFDRAGAQGAEGPVLP